MQNMRIGIKLPLMVILVSLITSLAQTIFAVSSATSVLEESSEEKLIALLHDRKEVLTVYFDTIKKDLNLLSENRQVIEAVQEFTIAWNQLDGYPTRLLQQAYIDENPNPIGQKENLDFAKDGSYYSDIHRKHHPFFRKLMRERGYFDVFLLDLNGNLVYSVYKEPDYATNLTYGDYKDSGLGQVYQAAADRSTRPGEQFFVDFEPYEPSQGVPASFKSIPLYSNGQKVGVLVVQVPIVEINNIMAHYDGLGETGETYIVGGDKLMRNKSRFSKKGDVLSTKVNSPSVTMALKGKSGIDVIEDARGVSVYSVYEPYEYEGLRWAIITEQDIDEALAATDDVLFTNLLVAVVVVGLVSGLGSLLSRTITVPLVEINKVLKALSEGASNVHVPFTERKEETGDLARAALVFKESATEKEKMRQKQKKAEALAEQEKKEAMRMLADDFENRVKHIISTVASAATQLANTAEHMGHLIQQSDATIQSATRNASQTSDNVRTVAAAAEEMSSSVQEISSQTQRSNDLVSNSVSKAGGAGQHAQALSDATEKVREVIQIIASIAGQINLLALNATIESARAGEAGKGFAVVASEVKNLAGQTNQSIEDISQVIGEMNAASDDIISSLKDISEAVDMISETSSGIATAVEEQSSTTNEIARSMQAAAQGTENISQNLNEVGQASSDVNEAAAQVLMAVQDVSQQAEELDRQVEEFLADVRGEA